MKITVKLLREQRACGPGIVAFQKQFQKPVELASVVKYAIKSKDFELLRYANWLIVRCLTHEQKVEYAIHAAELVIGIYEKKYPSNTAPRKAIEAAKAYLANPCEKTKKAADAAADAAYAAADAACATDAAAAARAASISGPGACSCSSA